MKGVKGGFTLLEVLVVLVIVGVAAAAAVPAFRPERAAAPIDVAADSVMALLRATRTAALTSGRERAIVIDGTRIRFTAAGGATAASIVVSAGAGQAVVRVDPWTGAIGRVR